PVEARPEQRPFPPGAFFFTTLAGTTAPSDSRSARCDFAFGLYAALCRDDGGRDGSLLFPTVPSARAAPRTPPRPLASHPDSSALGLAFAGKCSARPSDCNSDEAAGFTSCCGPRCCFRSSAFALGGF